MRRAVLLCLCLWPITAFAQSSAPDDVPLPPRLTLAEAIARASATSHRLGELAARRSTAAAIVGQRGAAQNPVLSAQLGYQRTNHVDPFGFLTATGFHLIYPDVPDNYHSRLELQWPIYTGGRLEALERAARAEATATGHELASARADPVSYTQLTLPTN
jgi:outer membrane protein TolC